MLVERQEPVVDDGNGIRHGFVGATHTTKRGDNVNDRPARKDARSLQNVLQLANVAGPRIRRESIHASRRYTLEGLRELALKVSQEVPNQKRNILGTFAERGNANREDVEPVEEV